MNQQANLHKPVGPGSLAGEADFRLGALQVHPSVREVRAGDKYETLEPRVMQVLVVLARAKGLVVSRDELVQQCWGGRAISDDAINKCVSKVRSVAGFSGTPAFEIETVPRVGYRLTENRLSQTPLSPAEAKPRDAVNAVESVPGAPSAPKGGRSSNRLWRQVVWVFPLLAVLVIAALAYRLLPIQAPPAAQPAAKPAPFGITLVVLPFDNMSGDPGQEFFSDGMTEEVNGALANVPGFHVIARSSAFQFKHQNRDVRSIAQLIGATHVLEGAVRKDGDRIRISVQLVRGTDGVTLWTQTYDRKLTDIFILQETIASSVAEALRVPLGLADGEQLIADRTSDLDSYEQYLRARALYRGRRVEEAVAVLRPAVLRDPGYAPAHSLLAMTYTLIPVYLIDEFKDAPVEVVRSRIAAAFANAASEARAALRLDPRQSEAYVALGLMHADGLEWAAAEDDFQRALSLNPQEADARHLYGLMLAATGRVKDALASRQKLRELEPFVPIYNIMTSAFLQLNGDDRSSIALLGTTPATGPTTYFRNIYLARAYAGSGQYEKAAEIIAAISPGVKRVSRLSIDAASDVLRRLASGRPLPSPLPRFEGELAFVYIHTPEPERVLDPVERDLALKFGDVAPFDSPWLPHYAAVRRTARFAAFVRNAHLVEYWKKRKWADHCHPVGSDDFACD